MTPVRATALVVRDVLISHDAIGEDDGWEFACGELARAAVTGDVQLVCQWLDALRIAVEDDPETRALATEIVDAVRKETPQ